MISVTSENRSPASGMSAFRRSRTRPVSSFHCCCTLPTDFHDDKHLNDVTAFIVHATLLFIRLIVPVGFGVYMKMVKKSKEKRVAAAKRAPVAEAAAAKKRVVKTTKVRVAIDAIRLNAAVCPRRSRNQLESSLPVEKLLLL